ncbi:MAG: hypothetical protein Q9210_000008 [Variospora velana]
MFALGESNQEWVEWRLAHNSFDSAILIAGERRRLLPSPLPNFQKAGSPFGPSGSRSSKVTGGNELSRISSGAYVTHALSVECNEQHAWKQLSIPPRMTHNFPTPGLGLRQRQSYLSPGAGSEHPQNDPSQVSRRPRGVAIVPESS